MNKHVLPRCNGSTRGYESSFIRDRKSTRLNSSHSQISYAVFCLKKKREQQTLLWSALISDILREVMRRRSQIPTSRFYAEVDYVRDGNFTRSVIRVTASTLGRVV